MVSFISQVVTSIKGTSWPTNEKDTGKCSGQMVHSTKVNGRLAYKVVKGKSIYQVVR